MTAKKIPYVLTISGSDSSGCAGLQADNRAIRSAGAMPLNVISANTLQTGQGVLSVHLTDPELIRKQALSLLEAYPVAAVKIGMLGNADAVQAVASVIEERPDLFVVVDPVLRSSSGHDFMGRGGAVAINRILLPWANLVTPNRQESLLIEAPENCATLLKGGHSEQANCCDELYLQGVLVERFCSSRVGTRNDRGTGCALSAGIAAFVAHGRDLKTAIGLAKQSLHASLEEGAELIFKGRGPAFF